MKVMAGLLFGWVIAFGSIARAEVAWMQPDGTARGTAVWGIPGGMSVGIYPIFGPRGLIRIYSQNMQQAKGRIVNFIAVEPIVGGHRGLSEMERSTLDQKQGKRMWTADTIDAKEPVGEIVPCRGIVGHEGSVEGLSFFVFVEKFENGAKPIVQVYFRSDRPNEVGLRTFAAADSAPLEACVLTATMGNWARLRHLQLNDRVIEASKIFQGQTREGWGFYPAVTWGADQLMKDGDDLAVSARGEVDRETPAEVPDFWRYTGVAALETWRTKATPEILARVNGRETFWASKIAIPGGTAFENFEMASPFHSGQEFRFSVTPANQAEGQHP